MIDQLLQVMADGDTGKTAKLVKNVTSGKEALAIYQAIFPVVQRVINPPYINPHWPKAYRVCREFIPYLEDEDIPALVRLEILENTRKPKIDELPRAPVPGSPVSFPEIEKAIKQDDRQKVAALLDAFLLQKGGVELARYLLLLGSGYLENTLGHSVSCTAFILLEMLDRLDQDPWPALATLADYFCKGQFAEMPAVSLTTLPAEETLNHHLLAAASGNGILNLHHTITRYSIERVRRLVSDGEYAHLINRWIQFMGDKPAEPPSLILSRNPTPEYDGFYRIFSSRDESKVLSYLVGKIGTIKGRKILGRYLIKGVCDVYQGDYDPHFLTGLGSALWVIERYHQQAPIAINALRQYVNYFL